jgi:hypothetical protein
MVTAMMFPFLGLTSASPFDQIWQPKELACEFAAIKKRFNETFLFAAPLLF